MKTVKIGRLKYIPNNMNRPKYIAQYNWPSMMESAQFGINNIKSIGYCTGIFHVKYK